MAAGASTKVIVSSSLAVLLGLTICFLVVLTGVFETAKVDLDLSHYAEKSDPNTFLKMPVNAMVNVGYLLVGVLWLKKLVNGNIILDTESESILYAVFSWMSILYSFVQFGRIVSLTRTFAVIDQWVTLPIFLWVVCWSLFKLKKEFSLFSTVVLQVVSVSSYSLTLIHEQGFELSLGLHILAAVSSGLILQKRLGDASSCKAFLAAVLCCAGFVFLKLLDHHLAVYPLFQRFTGHFWSKVCDAGQIHFVFRFFESLSPRPKTT